MKSLIISYTLENSKPHQKLQITRSLYGFEDISNNGSYKYKRKGLIDTCSGKKINRGVFIIPLKFKDKIISLLKKNKANMQLIPVKMP